MLKGEKLNLRALKIEDLNRMHQWRNDLELIRLTQGIRFPKTIEMESDWFGHVLNDKSNRNVFFGIEETSTNLFIGLVQIINIDWISGVADFGINIGDNTKTGRGYGKEAMRLFFNYIFYDLNLRKINLRVVDCNVHAKKVYLSFGFKQEGVLKNQTYINGKYSDIILMALFKEDYQTLTF